LNRLRSSFFLTINNYFAQRISILVLLIFTQEIRFVTFYFYVFTVVKRPDMKRTIRKPEKNWSMWQVFGRGCTCGALMFFGLGAWLHTGPVQAQMRPSYVAVEYARINNPGAAQVFRSMNSTNELAGGFQRNRRDSSSALILSGNNSTEEVASGQGKGHSVAYDINDQGEIAGAYNTGTSQRPFRSVRRTGFQELSLPAGSNGGRAYAINEIGEAAGYVSGASGVRPVWWTRRGEVQVLQSAGNQTAQANDLNERGDIVGVSGGATKVAVLWPRKGSMVSLPGLPGFTHSEAVSVSDNGTIAGVASGLGQSAKRFRAVLWQPGTLSVQDLGTLPGGTDSRARDVNNRGEVVGRAINAKGSRAFVWTPSTGMRDLNSLVNVPGLVMTDALSINKRGDIVVMGQDSTDRTGDHEHEDHHAAIRIFILRSVQ
jgi:probable HAF family extracellular repeat protein